MTKTRKTTEQRYRDNGWDINPDGTRMDADELWYLIHDGG